MVIIIVLVFKIKRGHFIFINCRLIIIIKKSNFKLLIEIKSNIKTILYSFYIY